MGLAVDGQGQDTALAVDGEEASDTATMASGAPGAGSGLAFTALILILTRKNLIPAHTSSCAAWRKWWCLTRILA